MTPIGRAFSRASLRRNGGALPWRFQSGLNMILEPVGTDRLVSASRRALRKSRLSIIDAVRVLQLTSEPERGRHGERVRPSATRRYSVA